MKSNDTPQKKDGVFSDRFYLFLVWFLGYFLCNMALYCIVYFCDGISFSDVSDEIDKISVIFVPYLGTIIAFWYIKDALDRVQEDSNRVLFIVAILCSILFNIAVVASIPVALSPVEMASITKEHVHSSFNIAQKVAASFSFIVGPVIGFYFGKPNQSPTETRPASPRLQ